MVGQRNCYFFHVMATTYTVCPNFPNWEKFDVLPVAVADLHFFDISPFLDWFILEIMSKEFTSTACQAIRDKTHKKKQHAPIHVVCTKLEFHFNLLLFFEIQAPHDKI